MNVQKYLDTFEQIIEYMNTFLGRKKAKHKEEYTFKRCGCPYGPQVEHEPAM